MFTINNFNISKLDLSNQNLTEFPDEIFKMKNLRSLNISNNKIKTIPSDIKNLKNLRTLDISFNQLDNIYAKICELKNLRILNLNSNNLKSFPVQFDRLENLNSLHIAKNKLTSIPDEIFKLVNLREIDLSNNQITELNSNIRNLTFLRRLWINNLPLKKLPFDEIKYLPNLKALYAFGQLNKSINIDPIYNKITQIKGNCKQHLHNLIDEKEIEKKAIEITRSSDQKRDIKNTLEPVKNKIFISYSHKDILWLERVQVHLKTITNHLKKDLEIWDDTKLKIGDKWKNEITKALAESSIAILLVSADFLASDFVNKSEIPPILEKAEKEGTKIFTLIVSPCLFKKSSLESYQAVNEPSKPLSSIPYADAESYLVTLTEQILNSIE